MRALAAGLLAYGVTGLVILVLVGAGLLGGLDRVEGLTASIERQRASLSAALDAADATMGSTGTALAGVNGSLAEAQQSLTQVGALATDLSSTMGTLAGALNVTILGSQPFASTSDGFARASIELQTVASAVGLTSAALGANTTDIVAVEAELARLRASVVAVGDGLDAMPGVSLSAGDIGILRLVVIGLLVWLAVQALAAVVIGGALVARLRREQARL